ncbi:CD151 antigen-like isoform X1 [Mytilus trossulus]|uniref:CD151 antigen-like isoform X1 n=1 Tax=Mytilus trossulus TaxID=6551 RepID=UPI0030040BF1
MGTKGNIKCCAAVFHFLIFIAGVSSLSMGIYIIASDYGAHQLSAVLGDELYHVAAYIAIAGGTAIAIISLCGVCGSLKEKKCVLVIYTVLMAIILVILLVTAILLFVFVGQMSGKIQKSMKIALVNKYGVNLDHSENRMVTEVWDLMQKNLECCGVHGGVNSTDSWAIYKIKSQWYKQGNNRKAYVPDSCCRHDGDIITCTGLNGTEGTPIDGPPISGNVNPHLYHKGCYDELVNYVQGHVLMIGGIAVASIVVILFGLIFSMSLYRSIREVDSY